MAGESVTHQYHFVLLAFLQRSVEIGMLLVRFEVADTELQQPQW